MTQTESFVEISNGRLWCVRGSGPSEQGAPTLVFLHGLSVDHRMWSIETAGLSDIASTISYDLRGFGRSSVPDLSHSHVDDLVALLDRCEAERVVLVGLSLGANIALSMAQQHPDRIDAMVLASSGLPGRAWTTPRAPDLALAHAHEHGIASAKDYWLGLPLFSRTRTRPAAKALLDLMVSDFPAYQWSVGGPKSKALPAVADLLESITCTTTIVTGEYDDAGYLSLGDELARRMPNAHQVRISDAGHFVNMDEPARFKDQIVALLDALSK